MRWRKATRSGKKIHGTVLRTNTPSQYRAFLLIMLPFFLLLILVHDLTLFGPDFVACNNWE
jgi:hypothetical protein